MTLELKFDSMSDWRLKNVRIEHSFGQQVVSRGWNSFLQTDGGYITQPDTIDSSKTPFEPMFLLVKPEVLGTHEATIGDPNDLKYVPEGYSESGFLGIDFSDGWHGPAIAVAAYCRCSDDLIIDNSTYDKVTCLINGKSVSIASGLGYGQLGVIDGHHRREMAASSLDHKLKYVPVQIIPFMQDDSVVLATWHQDGMVWSAQQVFECFKDPGRIADPKRTKFGVRGTDGVIRRILATQPSIHIPRENLI